MQTRTLRCATVLGIVVALFGTRSAAQGTDPVVGTWVLNVAKSTFSPGPAPKSESRTYVAAGKEIKVTSAGVGADGKPTAGGWTIVADGRDVPMTGNPNADTLSLKQIDAFSTEYSRTTSRYTGRKKNTEMNANMAPNQATHAAENRGLRK